MSDKGSEIFSGALGAFSEQGTKSRVSIPRLGRSYNGAFDGEVTKLLFDKEDKLP
jgi:hypothetical protein